MRSWLVLSVVLTAPNCCCASLRAGVGASWAAEQRRRTSAQSVVDEQKTVTWSTIPYLARNALSCALDNDCSNKYKCEENPLVPGQRKCHSCMASRSTDDCPKGYFCLVTPLASDVGKDRALLTGQCISSEWDTAAGTCGNRGTCCCPGHSDRNCRKNDCDSQVSLPGPLFCDCHTAAAVSSQCGSCVSECPAMTGHLTPLHWGDESKAAGMACMPGIAAAPVSAPPPGTLRTTAASLLAAAACFVAARQ
jgi:hypothetical protein